MPGSAPGQMCRGPTAWLLCQKPTAGMLCQKPTAGLLCRSRSVVPCMLCRELHPAYCAEAYSRSVVPRATPGLLCCELPVSQSVSHFAVPATPCLLCRFSLELSAPKPSPGYPIACGWHLSFCRCESAEIGGLKTSQPARQHACWFVCQIGLPLQFRNLDPIMCAAGSYICASVPNVVIESKLAVGPVHVPGDQRSNVVHCLCSGSLLDCIRPRVLHGHRSRGHQRPDRHSATLHSH